MESFKIGTVKYLTKILTFYLFFALTAFIGNVYTEANIKKFLHSTDLTLQTTSSDILTATKMYQKTTDYNISTSGASTPGSIIGTKVSPQMYFIDNQENDLATDIGTHSTTELNQFEVCNEFSTCDYIANLTLKHCQCDELCSVYGDCCPDARSFDNVIDSYPSNQSENYNQEFICSPYSNRRKDIIGVFIVKKCPDNYINTNISEKCETADIYTTGPFVTSEDNIVYQNRYCAECHRVDSFKPFSFKFSNVVPDFITIHRNETAATSFQFTFDFVQNPMLGAIVDQTPPKGSFPRYCILYAPGTHQTSECQDSGINPVMISYGFQIVVYRNRYCAPVRKTTCLTDASEVDITYGLHSAFPLSIMFAFSKSEKDCENQDYGFCFTDELYADYPFEKTMLLFSNVLLSDDQAVKLFSVLLWPLRLDVKFVFFRRSESEHCKEENCLFVSSFFINGFITKQMFKTKMLEYHSRLVNSQWQIKGNFLNFNNFEANTSSINKPLNKFVYSLTNLTDYILKTDIEFNPDSYHETVCEQFVMDIETSRSTNEFKFTLNNDICPQEYPKATSITTKDNSEIHLQIITYSGMGLSVIGLTASVVIQRKTDLHNSVPGSNIENLSVALLISTVLFMVGIGANDDQIVCYCVGVALHYLWLVVFAFKSIALIYMCHNIAPMRYKETVRKSSMNKTKTGLTLLGMIIPVLFVTPPLVFDYLNISEFHPEYAGSVCFPTGVLANVFFVSVPIGLSVLINVSCLLSIVFVITKQTLATKHLRKTVSFHYLVVYARISAVTGIFWVTGILSGVFSNVFFQYLFVTVCSFQGVFIAAANVTTKQVTRRLRTKPMSSSS